MMENELNTSDIKGIIDSLISFIVIDSKEYIQEEKKSEYVSSYVSLLVRTINQIEKNDPKFHLVENIIKDIDVHIK